MNGYPNIPGYRIESELGRGAMGVVVRATQLSLSRPVAIKLLQPSMAFGPDLLARFEREAKVVASLDHPNIVSVIDYGVVDGVPYIVMQFVEGVSLDSMLTGRAFPVLFAVRVLRQVAAALDYAHARNVVHRDVKPANVMIRSDGVVMLTDFGIAKASDAPGLTHGGMTLGTPAYMAPEICKGDPASPASDIYSLGVIAYEMLTGRRPFDSDNSLALMYKKLNDSPPDPTALLLEKSEIIVNALYRALERNAASRYRTATALVQGLSTQGDPVSPANNPMTLTGLVESREPGPDQLSTLRSENNTPIPVSTRTAAVPRVVTGYLAGLAAIAVVAALLIWKSGDSVATMAPSVQRTPVSILDEAKDAFQTISAIDNLNLEIQGVSDHVDRLEGLADQLIESNSKEEVAYGWSYKGVVNVIRAWDCLRKGKSLVKEADGLRQAKKLDEAMKKNEEASVISKKGIELATNAKNAFGKADTSILPEEYRAKIRKFQSDVEQD